MGYPSFSAGDTLAATDMNAVGLWKVGSIVFTGQTGANLDNVFTTNYRNYLVVADLTSSASETVIYQLRAGGTTNVGLNVSAVQSYFQFGTAGNFFNQITNQTYGYFAYTNTDGAGCHLMLYGPQLAKQTHTTAISPAVTFPSFSQNKHAVNTQYDGIRIASFTTATLTGRVDVYGLRN